MGFGPWHSPKSYYNKTNKRWPCFSRIAAHIFGFKIGAPKIDVYLTQNRGAFKGQTKSQKCLVKLIVWLFHLFSKLFSDFPHLPFYSTIVLCDKTKQSDKHLNWDIDFTWCDDAHIIHSCLWSKWYILLSDHPIIPEMVCALKFHMELQFTVFIIAVL